MTSELNQLYEQRKKRLRQLIERDYHSIAALCGKVGKKSSYLSLLFSGSRPFTEKMAREIEEKAGLPPRWLDQSEGGHISLTPTASPTVGTIAEEVAELDESDQLKVLLFVRELLIAKYRRLED